MAALDTQSEITSLLETWGREDSSGVIPIDCLVRMAELVERETEAYFKMDPDPFDDRHPGRADPTCGLGHLLKAVFKNDNLMTKMVGAYFLERTHRECNRLHEVTCRLLLGLMPGLEASIVFNDNDTAIQKLFQWAETAEDPLRSYATGVLGAAMECQDLATNYKEKNANLVPIMIKRLYALKNAPPEESSQDSTRAFAGASLNLPLSMMKEQEKTMEKNSVAIESETDIMSPTLAKTVVSDTSHASACTSTETFKTALETLSGSVARETTNGWPSEEAGTTLGDKCSSAAVSSAQLQHTEIDGINHANDRSNSSWAEMEKYVIGSYKLSPLSNTMKERLILTYLTPLGEYQELLSCVFEHRAIDLIFFYIDLKKNRDVRLAFGGLRYLASLLCHKKFAVEFIASAGIQRLLEVYRPSVAATGVSLCLYYLAYYEDAMERVCLLPQHVLGQLVNVMLWMLECSHQSGRCHAVMFFSMSFSFKVILDLFDRMDGLRKLLNTMSTLELMNVESGNENMTEDEEYTSRQTIRHVCIALRRYFEVHLAIKADELRRSHLRNEGGPPVIETPPFKPIHVSVDTVLENMDVLLDCLPRRNFWSPVAELERLGGITLLLQLVGMATSWSAYTGKAESICCALNTLAVCATTSRVQQLFIVRSFFSSVSLPGGSTESIIRILLTAAEGEAVPEPDVQKSALTVLHNLLCAASPRIGGRYISAGDSRRINMQSGQSEDFVTKMWDVFRSENIIMVLLKLLQIKSPITEADAIRALTCKCLVGLACSEHMRQIMSKLPLFNNEHLQQLMKEPVLQDKRHEHVKFYKYANELTEMVSGKSPRVGLDGSLETIHRATVVAETRITYDERELLQLIQDHLVSRGLTESARALQNEASLPTRCTTPPALPHPITPQIYSSAQKNVMRQTSVGTSTNFGIPSTSATPGTSSRPCPGTPGTPLAPIKVNIIQSKAQSSPALNISGPSKVSRIKTGRTRSDMPCMYSSPGWTPRRAFKRSTQEASVSLNKIVTEYLKQQHALCKNPVVTCPVFSLLEPHRCPDPKQYITAPTNITSRMFRRSGFPKFGGPEGDRFDRKYIYSKFRPIRSYRDSEADGCFSSCAFSACEQWMMLGTYAGELKLYNMITAEEAGAYVCHTSPINHLQPSADGMLVLTSSSWGTPLSACWTLGDVFDVKLNFEEDHYVEFSKVAQDRIVGTKEETATIYDVTTGQTILTLTDKRQANKYTRNRATFDPSDDLVLSDGVLWDVNSGKLVHKFDKFNPHVSGVFHPMGLEVIINSEVWDMRTYKLLHTVPALDQCQIRFNNSGDIIYGAIHQAEDDDLLSDNPVKSPFGSSFRTFDASDYSNIATIDVKKNIYDLCTDNTDCYLAVIENTKNPDNFSEESICRLYEVGRHREEDEEADEEEETNMEDEEDEEASDIEDIISQEEGENILAGLLSDNAEFENADDDEDLDVLLDDPLLEDDDYTPDIDAITEDVVVEEAPSVGSYRLAPLTSEGRSDEQQTDHALPLSTQTDPNSSQSLSEILMFEDTLALFPDLLLPVSHPPEPALEMEIGTTVSGLAIGEINEAGTEIQRDVFLAVDTTISSITNLHSVALETTNSPQSANTLSSASLAAFQGTAHSTTGNLPCVALSDSGSHANYHTAKSESAPAHSVPLSLCGNLGNEAVSMSSRSCVHVDLGSRECRKRKRSSDSTDDEEIVSALAVDRQENELDHTYACEMSSASGGNESVEELLSDDVTPESVLGNDHLFPSISSSGLLAANDEGTGQSTTTVNHSCNISPSAPSEKVDDLVALQPTSEVSEPAMVLAPTESPTGHCDTEKDVSSNCLIFDDASHGQSDTADEMGDVAEVSGKAIPSVAEKPDVMAVHGNDDSVNGDILPQSFSRNPDNIHLRLECDADETSDGHVGERESGKLSATHVSENANTIYLPFESTELTLTSVEFVDETNDVENDDDEEHDPEVIVVDSSSDEDNLDDEDDDDDDSDDDVLFELSDNSNW